MIPGFEVSQHQDRLVLTPTRGAKTGNVAALILLTLLCVFCFRAIFLPVWQTYQMRQAHSLRGGPDLIIFSLLGLLALLLALFLFGSLMSVARSSQPLIFDSHTGCFEHGKQVICALGRIACVQVTSEYVSRAGYRYPVYLCFIGTDKDPYRLATFSNQEQAEAFAQPISIFVGRQTLLSGGTVSDSL